MDLSRTEYAKRNIAYGFFRQIVAIMAPFITRTVMIKTLGAEFTGLSGLFGSVMLIFSVSELGFATAIIHALYVPIAARDECKICEILNFFRLVYKKIGICLLILSVAILPFIPYLIRGDVPHNVNVYLLFFLTALYSIAGYFLFAYKEVLVNACQRQEIISKIDIVVILLQFLGQCGVLILWRNYYLFLIIQIVSVICRNLSIGYYSRKKFSKYRPEGILCEAEKHKIYTNVKGIAIGKLASASRNALDVVFISYFCGLVYVTIYQNYYFAYAAVLAILGSIANGIMASIGNSIATSDMEKNYQDYLKFDFCYWILRLICSIGLLLFYQPFMTLWVGEHLLLDEHGMLLFVVYFYIASAGGIRSAYIAGVGIWCKLKRINLLELICNIVLNFALVIYAGLEGVIAASIIIVLIFSIIGNSIVLLREYFYSKMINFAVAFFRQTVLAFIFLGMAYIFSHQIGAAADVIKLIAIFAGEIVVVVFTAYFIPEYRCYIRDIVERIT